MRYLGKLVQAEFILRPNRFVAHCSVNGVKTVVHVKNTGRCRELLVPGAKVILEKSSNPARKTEYDLISVWKGNRLVNMDSSAPNLVAREWIAGGGLGFTPTCIRPEVVCGSSRYDFYLEHDGHPCFAEVKGVTLEENGIARFPDAPTERGIKHLNGLAALSLQGIETYIIFIIQMDQVDYFEPNGITHPSFAEALRSSADAGVRIIAVDCTVTESEIFARSLIPINLQDNYFL